MSRSLARGRTALARGVKKLVENDFGECVVGEIDEGGGLGVNKCLLSVLGWVSSQFFSYCDDVQVLI